MELMKLPPMYSDWEIVRKIGQGSFGAVYEIERDLFGRTEKAALKYISIPQHQEDIEELYESDYSDADITEHFKSYLADIVREYSLMAEIKGHTNVVYCDDIRYIQHDDGFGWDIFIKMELLTPMLKSLNKEAIEEETVKIGKDICNALVLCKEKGIVHRDIKPQNIFVSDTGDYKLGDFGVAKTIERTTGGTKIGTYNYMAPEVYNNQPYNNAADVYSLGLVLYWLLNERRLPFLPLPPKGPTALETESARTARFSGKAIPEPKNGSEELKAIVLKACAFDPKDRYQSAQEMQDALNALGNRSSGSIAVAENASSVAANEVSDEETVGPGLETKEDVPQTEADEKTIGPVFATKETRANEDIGERTPDGACEPTPKGKGKRKYLIPLIAAVFCLILVGVWIGITMGGQNDPQMNASSPTQNATQGTTQAPTENASSPTQNATQGMTQAPTENSEGLDTLLQDDSFRDLLRTASDKHPVRIAVLAEEAYTEQTCEWMSNFVESMIKATSDIGMVAVTGHGKWNCGDTQTATFIIDICVAATMDEKAVQYAAEAALEKDDLIALFCASDGAVAGCVSAINSVETTDLNSELIIVDCDANILSVEELLLDGSKPTEEQNSLAGTYAITIWVPQEIVELTERQIEDFNDTNKSGIIINATVAAVSEGDAAGRMIESDEAGADIFCFAQDRTCRLIQAGALAQCGEDSAAVVVANNDTASVAAVTNGDTVYGYPLTSDNGYFMYYDKSVISEKDVDSLEALIEACENSGRKFSFNLENSWYAVSFFFGAGCVSEWTVDIDGDFLSVCDSFNTESGIIAAKGMEQLITSSCYVCSDSANFLDSAIVISGTWDYDCAKSVWGDNLGVTDLPSFTVDGKSYHLGSFSGCKLMGVKPQESPVREAVLHELALYLSGENCQIERYDGMRWIPSNLNAQLSSEVRSDEAVCALLKQNCYSTLQREIHGSWWDIGKAIARNIKNGVGLKESLQIYENEIDKLFHVPDDERNAWTVIGSIEGTSWSVDLPMTELGDGTWKSDEAYVMDETTEFKVRQGKSWDVNYGLGGVVGGDNATLEGLGFSAGIYYILFDPVSGEISLLPK